MEWLTNLLGFANNGTSPFGSLASGPGAGGAAPGLQAASSTFGNFNPGAPAQTMQAAQANGATPPGGGGMQFPGLLGKLLGQQQQPAQAGQGGGANNALMNQAMNLIKGPQMQQPQWMNLLSGPRG